MNIHVENGYKNRKECLSCLAEDFGIDLEVVTNIASTLGRAEAFDYLVTLLEDYTE